MPPLGLASSPCPAPSPRSEPAWSVESLYRAHAKSVARWAMRLLGPGADYEDVVHDVFMVVKRRLPEFRGDASVTTWLYEITVRVAQTSRRRNRWWSWLTAQGPSPGRGRALPPPAPPPFALDPQAELEARERARLLYALLDELGEDQRTALILFELEGLSGEQIAELTGASVGTVWVRLSRGRQKFLERLRAWEARQKP